MLFNLIQNENNKGEESMFDLVPFRSHGNITKKGDAFDRLFDYMFDQPFGAMSKLGSAFSTFKVDVKDKGAVYELVAELPGVKKEGISLNYEHDYLTIGANREEETEDQKENYVCRERHVGKMQRSFFINDIDETNIKAQFKDGVLIVDLPKLTAEKIRKQIAIE